MNRRDLLLLRVTRTHAVVLPCEELYMRYLDSQLDNTTAELFDRLRAELREADSVHLADTTWFADEDFRQALDRVLAAYRAAGGHVAAATAEPLRATPRSPR
jgi:spore coat protein CotH